MPELAMRDYAPSDATRVRNLQVRYAQAYPGAAVISREVYSYPAFQGGRNVRGAFDPQGDLVGYAPMFPQPVLEGQIAAPHVIWADPRPSAALGGDGQELEGADGGRAASLSPSQEPGLS